MEKKINPIMDLNLGTLEKIIPSCIIIGGLGWVMGMILDQPKKRKRISYTKMLTHDAIKHEAPKASPTEAGSETKAE